MKISWRKVSLWLLPIAIIGFFADHPAHSRPTANIDQPIDAIELVDISGVFSNARITDLRTLALLENTRIYPNPKDAVVSRISGEIEDIEWIPARGNVAGKKGIVTVIWLVDPSGKVENQWYKLEGDRELVEIVIQAARDYRFKPNERSRKYRLVIARYIFPAESMDIRGVYLLNPHVPLPSTNFEIDYSREFVKPRNSNPLGSQQSINQPPRPPINQAPSQSSIPLNQIDNIGWLYEPDSLLIDLLAQNRLDQTVIVPKEANVSRVLITDVTWKENKVK